MQIPYAKMIGFKASGQSNLVKATLNLWAKLALTSNTIILGSPRVSTRSRSLIHLPCLHSEATWSRMTDNNAGKFSLAHWRCLHKHTVHGSGTWCCLVFFCPPATVSARGYAGLICRPTNRHVAPHLNKRRIITVSLLPCCLPFTHYVWISYCFREKNIYWTKMHIFW